MLIEHVFCCYIYKIYYIYILLYVFVRKYTLGIMNAILKIRACKMLFIFWVNDCSKIWTWPPKVHRCNEGSSFCSFALASVGPRSPSFGWWKSKGWPFPAKFMSLPRSTLLLVQNCLLTYVFFSLQCRRAMNLCCCPPWSMWWKKLSLQLRAIWVNWSKRRWPRRQVVEGVCLSMWAVSPVISQDRAVTPRRWVITPVIQLFMPFWRIRTRFL